MHYRNMKITELPDTPVDAAHVAIANRSYRSLYTGLDLSGWEATSASAKEHWHVQDWTLSFDGGKTPVDGILSSSEALNNTGFLFDIRPGHHCDGFSLGNLILANTLKQDEWHRVEGTVQDGKLTLSINGKTVVTAHALDTAVFHLGPNGAADFANIYIRKLAE